MRNGGSVRGGQGAGSRHPRRLRRLPPGRGVLGNPDEWFPIYPGTDGALASAIAYVIISEGKHDKAFLDKYVVGFDADTMPESAPANSSYMDYIMGTGYDNIPKTPEWAAPICGLPSEKITYLAHS